MNYNIYINSNNEEDYITIINNEDEIRVYVNDISEIYPNITKQFRKKVNKQIEMYKEFISDGSEYHQKEEKRILKSLNDLENKVASKNTENESVILNSYTDKTLENLEKYFPSTCVIDITNKNDDEIIAFLTENNFSNKIKFIGKYTSYDQLSSGELLDMYKTIYTIKNKINEYNFTPLEKVIYIYDEVRKKPYKDTKKSMGASRNLNEILSNDSIVCEGYANIIQALCTALDIKCEKTYWIPKEGIIGHASNLVYINDEYYDVHGFYCIDATATNSGVFSNYLERYDTFLVPLDYITKLYDRQHNYNRLNNSDDSIKNSYERTKKFIELNAPKEIVVECITYLIEKMKNIYTIIGDNDKIDECNKALSSNGISFEMCDSIYNEYKKLSKISPDDISITKAIYKVKRIEYLENPLENKLDVETLKNSYMTIPIVRKTMRLLEIFGSNVSETYIGNVASINELSNIEAKSSEERITKDIKRLAILNTLKNEFNSRIENSKTYKKK